MDYGQPTNNSQEAGFFTAGVGGAPEKLNPDAENSLNTGVYSPDHDPRNLGNTAILSPESPELPESSKPQEALSSSPETSENQPENPDQLGQVINLEMPPVPTEETPEVTQLFNKAQITSKDGHISHETVQACEKTTTDYKHDQISPADLVNFRDEASEAYRESYSNPSEGTK